MKHLLMIMICGMALTLSTRAQDTLPRSANNCIAIMGDSSSEGTFVALLPGSGVTVLQGTRIASLLHDALGAQDLLHYGIYDLSLGASAISAPNNEPYLTSREFELGRSLNCRYVVVFPFLNDLYTSDDTLDGIIDYQEALNMLISDVQTYSPDSHLILLNFYAVRLQGVGETTYDGNVSAEHVATLNTLHEDYCADYVDVTCLPLNDLLTPIEDYVIGSIPRAVYDAEYRVYNAEDQALVDSYWANRSTPIEGDGLHLNPEGQMRLVEALMTTFERIDVLNFAPILR
ncbi:MAG: hypothetical protein ACFE0Q_14930 [Anaerolineae bacterium]